GGGAGGGGGGGGGGCVGGNGDGQNRNQPTTRPSDICPDCAAGPRCARGRPRRRSKTRDAEARRDESHFCPPSRWRGCARRPGSVAPRTCCASWLVCLPQILHAH